jgi:hypothetical protein
MNYLIEYHLSTAPKVSNKFFCFLLLQNRIEIIPDRHDDFNTEESSLTKSRRKNKQPLEIPTVIPSGLSQERRLEIIEDILKKFSQINVLDEIRRVNAIPYQLPK